MFGCPVKCLMCDAGSFYRGKLSKEEILSQIDYLVKKKFPDRRIPVKKFKIQFSRLGEPSLNPSVLDVLVDLPNLYEVEGLIPSLSTVAPQGTDGFFDKLLEIKNSLFNSGRFQLQFSIHTTDEKRRDKIIPIKKWDLKKLPNMEKNFIG